jgi:pantoate--beta-alanine ligase
VEIIRSVDAMIEKIRQIKKKETSIGFVPTMGFLHEGHLSLIREAKANNEIAIVSVFVNPTQFGPNEDLENYPRNEEKDTLLCTQAGCDYMFIPEPKDMYREGYNTYVEVYGLTEGLCGASRPSHFRGVCTVVLKLFNIVKPDRAYFGQKDAQQLAIIKKMVSDLNLDVDVIGCPIVREVDGLAMSSRNAYLSTEERQEALVLSKSLIMAKALIEAGEKQVFTIKEEMIKIINGAKSSIIDYIEFVDSRDLKPITRIEGEILVAMAVRIGRTRLIDNMVVNK